MKVDELHRALDELAGPVAMRSEDERRAVAQRVRRQRVRRAVPVSLIAAALVAALVVIVVRPGTDSGSRVVAGPSREGGVLYLSDGYSKVTKLDVATGAAQTVTLPGMFPGDPPYRILRRGDRLVYWGRTTDTYEFATFSIGLDLRSAPRLVDRALFFVPSSHPGRIWLVYGARGGGAPEAVREVTLDGAETVPRTPLPPKLTYYPEMGVGDGLVLESGRGLVYWTRDGRVRPLPGNARALAARADVVAVETGRMLQLVDVNRGKRREIALPPGVVSFSDLSGSFSPDGRTLAVFGDLNRAPPLRGVILLVDLASGGARVLPGTDTDNGGSIAWSSTGGTLYAQLGQGSFVAYDRGDASARDLPVPPGAYTSPVGG